MIACTVYLYIPTFGANVRFCRWEGVRICGCWRARAAAGAVAGIGPGAGAGFAGVGAGFDDLAALIASRGGVLGPPRPDQAVIDAGDDHEPALWPASGQG